MIHHQHFFPVVNEHGRLLPAFLAVVNTEPDDARTIARNLERVLVARLRDARFFWDADRRTTLEARLPRLDTVLFHKRLGSYRAKAARIERAGRLDGRRGAAARRTPRRTRGRPARLAKADLATDMVRELTELQGTMGGIYAREEGLPEEVWRRSTTTTCRSASRPTRRRRAADLGAAAVDVGGGVARRQARHASSGCSRRASGRRARATRSACGARRRACCGRSSTCRN